MMRESVQSWTQDPWSLIDNNNNTLLENTSFDSSLFADQVLQLQDLFGQDELDFTGADTSLLYDEFTSVLEISSTTIEPSDLMNQSYLDNIISSEPSILAKRHRSSSCSSSYSSSSSSSEEDVDQDFSSLTTNRRYSSSSDSEIEQEVISPYVHRRQMEEMILDKITHHLDAEKLPGILTIISKKHQDEQVEEVEIDLARLERDQLERILSYVNACLIEKKGGPRVKLSDYTVLEQPARPQKKAGPTSKPKPSNRRDRRHTNRRKSIIDQGHVVNGSSTPSQLSSAHGPISMSALAQLEASKKSINKKKRAKKNKDDVSVHMSSTHLNTFKESIASTKPKRKSAIHKRRILEEMLQPSSNEEDDSDEDNTSGIIVFGDEQMDLAVTHNKTIVHQDQSPSITQGPANIFAAAAAVYHDTADCEDDELIDIMM